MYSFVVIVTNLWMRLFPNYKEYFFWSERAQFNDEYAFQKYCEFWNMASTISRGYLLSTQLDCIQAIQSNARLFDEIARNCMQPITVKMLQYKYDNKPFNFAYNIAIKGV